MYRGIEAAVPRSQGGAANDRPAAADASPHLPRELSAEQVLSGPQRFAAVVLLTALALLLTIAFPITLVVLTCCCCGFGVLAAIHGLLVGTIGARGSDRCVPVELLPDAELPTYTVLAPLRDEAAAVGGLVRSLAALDYPKGSLEIRLIVEVDDVATLEALAALSLGPQFEILLLPKGEPKTKPRACNFGLRHARGELAVIFDAEDRPEPHQLRKAAAALHAAPADVACCQAKLDYWNPTTNLLTRFATGEYSAMWEIFRPGLDRLRAPIPLGGTSNHFPIRALRGLGAWDEFNVTEDIDLGTRLARAGYRTRMLDSTTYGEANTRLGNWFRQRSRWIKGWLQTWLVHTRHPLRLTGELGARGALHFHMTVLAAIVPPLFSPIGWALAALWLLSTVGLVDARVPPWLLTFAAVSLLCTSAIGIWTTALGLRKRGYGAIVLTAFLTPLYELLKAVAAWKAVWQLITRPHYWEKTAHGLDEESVPAALSALAVDAAGSG